MTTVMEAPSKSEKMDPATPTASPESFASKDTSNKSAEPINFTYSREQSDQIEFSRPLETPTGEPTNLTNDAPVPFRPEWCSESDRRIFQLFRFFPRSGRNSQDWRWQMAKCIAEMDIPLDFRPADPLVLDTASYLLRGQEGRDWLPSTAKTEQRVLEAAIALYHSPALHRAELEARILARQDTATIATKLGVDVDVVDTYHDLFFDVRGKLDCSSYVMRVIRGDEEPFVAVDDHPTLLKLLAYGGGPHVLESLLWFFECPPKVVPLRLGTLTRAELEELRLWVGIRMTILAITFVPENDIDRIRIQYLALPPKTRKRRK